MQNCNNGINIPTLETDPCNGERVSAGCVVDSGIYSELSLPENATQQEINQAMYLAFLNLKATTENIDATVSGLDGSETKIEAGDNVEITGSGTTVNPYIINSPAIDSRPYKVYTALLTHFNGISNPSVMVLENTLGGEIIWTRSSTGRYTGTLLDIFTLNKTAFFGVIDDTKNIILGGSATSSSTIGISIIDGNTGLYTDSSFQTITIEIRVYN